MRKRLSIANPFGGTVWYRERTTSTMLDIAELLRRGEPEGTIAVAGFQESGRGRFAERRWSTPAGEALLFTVALRAPRIVPDSSASFPPGAPEAKAARLAPSLRLGLGVSLFLESLGVRPQIKWPNDVVVNGRKICGILVVGSLGWYHAGIGLNLRQDGFPEGLRRPATSLRLEGRDLEPLEALPLLLPFLRSAYEEKEARIEIERRLASLHEETEVVERPGLAPRRGRVLGIDADGALLLETKEGAVRCITGE